MNMIFIFCAKYLIIIPIIGTLYVLWKDRRQNNLTKRIATVLTASLLAYLLAKICSHFYYDPRPFVVTHTAPLIAHVADNGFPSDHVLLAATLAAIVTRWDKRVGSILWVATGLIAIGRIYVGVHHLADCLGSVLIALIAASIVHSVLNRMRGDIIST